MSVIEPKIRGLLLGFILSLLLAGCSSTRAPISSLEQPPSVRIQVHQVAPGDTLYSIAWRYDLDYRRLAQANGIRAPYAIHVGQRLSLDISQVAINPPPQQRKTTVTKAPVRAPATTAKAPAKSSPTVPSGSVQSPKTESKKPAPTAVAKSYGGDWVWPVKGAVIKTFNPAKLQKGVDIKGLARSSVRAAAPGVVVYAGQGLRGYGKLIIIKHSEVLLSAYAHNQSIMVSEGQQVKQSEVISRVADDGVLYFEIRRDGQPVNPVTYLQ